ncbi:MAG: 5-formyltetrahydrofolate cyclo-ligase [Nocardioides sp.]
MADPQTSPSKIALRDQLLTTRHRLAVVAIGEAARGLATHLLALPEMRRAATVATYVSVGSEPGTGPLIDALQTSGRRVLLPRLLPDNDLDWSVYEGPGSLVSAGRGLLEPAGRLLGVEAIAHADVVLVPGLAVDAHGNRLGRGGGSYDRALGRVPVGTMTCVLLYDHETGQPVPVEPHDRPVAAAATPSGILRLR